MKKNIKKYIENKKNRDLKEKEKIDLIVAYKSYNLNDKEV